MGVPVRHPAASTTTARKPNAGSPTRRSFREGRTSRREGAPGELQSGLEAAVGAGLVSSEVGRPAGAVADPPEATPGAGAGAAAPVSRFSDASRFTSAMQRALLMVSS